MKLKKKNLRKKDHRKRPRWLVGSPYLSQWWEQRISCECVGATCSCRKEGQCRTLDAGVAEALLSDFDRSPCSCHWNWDWMGQKHCLRRSRQKPPWWFSEVHTSRTGPGWASDGRYFLVRFWSSFSNTLNLTFLKIYFISNYGHVCLSLCS